MNQTSRFCSPSRALAWIAVLAAAGLCSAVFPVTLVSAANAGDSQIESPTHRQIRILHPKVDGETVSLQTLTTDSDGTLLVAVGGNTMSFEMNDDGTPNYVPKSSPGYVLRLDSSGKELTRWKLDLTPTAIAVSPSGNIFVGGSGKVAKLGADGKVTQTIDSPHVGNRKTFAKRTIAAQQRLMRSFMSEENLQPIRDMVEKLEEKPEEDRSRIEEAQLKAFRMQLEQMEAIIGDQNEEGEEADEEDAPLDPMMQMQVDQAMGVTSMAASQSSVFVCASDPENGGYSIWRLDQDLESSEATIVKKDLRGCCGQMDIQCCDEKLVLSENGAFRVGVYDLDGKSVSSFGQMDRSSEKGFGSCCNPMNSLPLADGTVLTAESSIGHIKHFDLDGNLIGYIGKAKIGGGCKHCALGYDAENDLYYMMYQDTNGICVLGNREDHPITDAERMVAQRQDDFLKAYAGTWAKEGVKDQPKGFFAGLFGGGEEASSGMDAMAPFTSWTINPDGSLRLNAGQYAQFVQTPVLELLPAEKQDAENQFRVGVVEAQVRMLDVTLTIDGDNMHASFGHGMEVDLIKRSSATTVECQDACPDGCNGSDCGKEECKHTAQVAGVVSAAADAGMEFTEVREQPTDDPFAFEQETVAKTRTEAVTVKIPQATRFETYIPTPTFAYKLLLPAALGEDKEQKLNEMGDQGWEFCGRIGKELMFKRIKGLTSNDEVVEVR